MEIVSLKLNRDTLTARESLGEPEKAVETPVSQLVFLQHFSLK